MTTANRSTVVGVFNNQDDAEHAVERLRDAGFDSSNIGFAGHGEVSKSTEDTAEKVGGGAAGGALSGGVVGGVLGAVAAGLIPGVGPILGAGILAATVGGAGIGAAAGGLLGALTGMGLSEDEAQYYENEFKSGRTLVTVKAEGRYDEAATLLRSEGAYDITTQGGATPRTDVSQTRETPAQTGTMELREEQLRTGTERVQTGEARIQKDVIEETQTVDVPVTREEVVVERRPVDGRPASSGSIGSDQEIRVPVHEDQVQVDKETVVTEELDVQKRTIEGTERVEETVRREEPRIEGEQRSA